jgi:hypothetical protein
MCGTSRRTYFQTGVNSFGAVLVIRVSQSEYPVFPQDNLKPGAGVLRGLHYQAPPHAQGKLVSVVSGSILMSPLTCAARPGMVNTLSAENGGPLYVLEWLCARLSQKRIG